ncbi:MAG: YhbY family RNA-binding protein [Treponema sp.]|nr:YhbY family RNA-binding protein [Treponema sp.]MBQ7881430.1 YhbY family RNA-binding protein [Treponema sp.]
MINLTSKQRKILEKAAQPLSSLVQIGGAGVTEEQINQISRIISEHELVKIKFNDYKDEKKELSQDISEKTNSTLVRIIGNTAIFYKPSEEEKNRKFEKLLLKSKL